MTRPMGRIIMTERNKPRGLANHSRAQEATVQIKDMGVQRKENLVMASPYLEGERERGGPTCLTVWTGDSVKREAAGRTILKVLHWKREGEALPACLAASLAGPVPSAGFGFTVFELGKEV